MVRPGPADPPPLTTLRHAGLNLVGAELALLGLQPSDCGLWSSPPVPARSGGRPRRSAEASIALGWT